MICDYKIHDEYIYNINLDIYDNICVHTWTWRFTKMGISSTPLQAAVSGYADKYIKVVHVPRAELTTPEISAMRDAVATCLHVYT